jgi:tRNA(Ile)-lysidine synthase
MPTEIEYPLLFRKWKTGRLFLSPWIKKKEKAFAFFYRSKAFAYRQGKIWIVESNKRIIWVMGYRIDDRFKITPSTKKVLEISMSKLLIQCSQVFYIVLKVLPDY